MPHLYPITSTNSDYQILNGMDEDTGDDGDNAGPPTARSLRSSRPICRRSFGRKGRRWWRGYD